MDDRFKKKTADEIIASVRTLIQALRDEVSRPRPSFEVMSKVMLEWRIKNDPDYKNYKPIEQPEYIVIDELIEPMSREKRVEWLQTFEARLAIRRTGFDDLAYQDEMENVIRIQSRICGEDAQELRTIYDPEPGYKRKIPTMAKPIVNSNRTNRSPGASAPMKRGHR